MNRIERDLTADQFEKDLRADRRGLFLCAVAGWDVSVESLAARTGLCQATIRSWARRRRVSRPQTVAKIRRALRAIAREN